LDYGQKLQQLDPKFPIEGATNFKRSNYLDVATGLGLSEGSVSGNYEKYSFSTARAAQIPERDNFKMYQQLMILSFIEEYFREWLKYAILTKFIDLPLSKLDEYCDAACFHPKNWPYIQPVQDAQADIELIEARLKSPQQVLAESEGSHNAEDVLAEISEFEQMAKDYNVELGEVTKPTIAKGEPGQIDPAQEDTPPPSKNGKARFELNGH
jgi:capsid protein